MASPRNRRRETLWNHKSLMLDFQSPCNDYILTFDQDDKVAYAYLKKRSDSAIVGKVWLYNRCATPQVPEWVDRDNIPFANCKGYMSENGRISLPVGTDDVRVDWENENGFPVAYIYIFQDLYGVVGVGDHPGYARWATKDTPLARVMEIEDDS